MDLAAMHEEGKGVELSIGKADDLYCVAWRHGADEARPRINKIIATLLNLETRS